MAQYQVQFACGHVEEKRLFGPGEQRRRYIAWAGEAGECSACRKADEQASAEALEAEFGLPTLRGSEKQIAWARTIRAKAISEIRTFIDARRADAEQRGQIEKFEAEAAALMQFACEPDDGRYWIDSRDMTTRDRLRELLPRIPK